MARSPALAEEDRRGTLGQYGMYKMMAVGADGAPAGGKGGSCGSGNVQGSGSALWSGSAEDPVLGLVSGTRVGTCVDNIIGRQDKRYS